MTSRSMLALCLCIGCEVAPPLAPRVISVEQARASHAVFVHEIASARVPVAIDLEAVPWLEAETAYQDAGLIMRRSAGGDFMVEGIPLDTPAQGVIDLLAWEPAASPERCRGEVRWHALDHALRYHRGEGVYEGARCTIGQVRIARVRPVPIINRLFLALRRRCLSCPPPRDTLVLIGPEVTASLGVEPIAHVPYSLVELAAEAGSGASVELELDSYAATKWARLVDAPDPGGTVIVGIEVAHPSVIAHVTVVAPR